MTSTQDEINAAARAIATLTVSAEELASKSADVLNSDVDESVISEDDKDHSYLSSPVSTPPKVVADEINSLLTKKKETAVTKSGSEPLMVQEEMSKATKKTSQFIADKIDSQYTEALQLVSDWSTKTKRSLSKEERDCLITALLSQSMIEVSDFDKILLGYTIRGEHNLNETRNVLNALQEMAHSMVASNKDFQLTSKRLTDGLHSLITRNPGVMQPKLIAAPPVSHEATSSKVNEVISQTSVPPDQPSITPTDVNKIIKLVAVGETGYIETVESFCEIMGRTLKWMKAAAKKSDVEIEIIKFIQVNQIPATITPVQKKAIWGAFTQQLK
ncbi:TPA_asm: protein 2 [Aconitum virus 1]|uniref:Protein 2 n=1 Tax=Aconitum virus 1 TaxID=2977949 RepID=A0A9N6YJ90_9RHAB|nr:TPA_asm: protein 2 [Aconitum virus 1]